MNPPAHSWSQSFRSQNGRVPGVDGAFETFQRGNNLSGHKELLRTPNGQVADNFAHSAQPLHGAFVPSTRILSNPETAVSIRPDVWSQEFAHSQLNGFATSSATAPDFTALINHTGQYSPRTAFQDGLGTSLALTSIASHVSGLSTQGNSFGMSSSPSMSLKVGHYVSPYRPSMQQSFTDPVSATAIAGSAIGTREPFLTADAAARSSQEDQAFNDAFKAFDDCEFQHEMAQWMAEHGPGEAAHANQDVQQLAEDLETRLTAGDTSVPLQEREEGDELAQQHELAKAAQSILDTVAGNENPKFKKSVFMSTMRRIAAYEVVAKDYDLVDAKTGDSIVTGAIVDEEAKERTEDSKVAVG